jgi:hypothetical protein
MKHIKQRYWSCRSFCHCKLSWPPACCCLCTITMVVLAPMTVAILALLSFLSHLIVKYLRNPLRKMPAAHPLAHFTSLWIHSVRWRSIENATLKSAHNRLGPIICLGPDEISVNCVKGGIREVYAGGFEKGESVQGYNWYSFFSNYGGYVHSFECNKKMLVAC